MIIPGIDVVLFLIGIAILAVVDGVSAIRRRANRRDICENVAVT